MGEPDWDMTAHWRKLYFETAGQLHHLADGAALLMLDVLHTNPADPNACELRQRLDNLGLLHWYIDQAEPLDGTRDA